MHAGIISDLPVLDPHPKNNYPREKWQTFSVIIFHLKAVDRRLLFDKDFRIQRLYFLKRQQSSELITYCMMHCWFIVAGPFFKCSERITYSIGFAVNIV